MFLLCMPAILLFIYVYVPRMKTFHCEMSVRFFFFILFKLFYCSMLITERLLIIILFYSEHETLLREDTWRSDFHVLHGVF